MEPRTLTSLNPAELTSRIPTLAGHKVLVVGDIVLDEYLVGRPSRVSREAPVLILDEVERQYRAGSAANPAANVVALGSAATLVGAVGDDAEGEHVRSLLERSGIAPDGLVVQPERTAVKSRILAEGFTGGLFGRQQVLRIDRVPVADASLDTHVAACVRTLAPRHDVVLLSDYRGGVVGPAAISAAHSSGCPVAVDSQGDVRRFRGADLVKLNQFEAQAAIEGPDLEGGIEALRREIGVRFLVVTLGGDGMHVFADEGSFHLPAANVTEVFDVTGAGDTVIAVLTLGLIAGLSMREAAALANAAASVVVRRLGVATVSPEELAAALAAR